MTESRALACILPYSQSLVWAELCRPVIYWTSLTHPSSTNANVGYTTAQQWPTESILHRPALQSPSSKRPRNTLLSITGMGTPLRPPCVTFYTPDARLRRESLLAKQTAQGS